jgi:hypothetical protein
MQMSVVDGSNDAMRSLLTALDILSNNNQQQDDKVKKDLLSFCESNERGRDKNKRGEREGEDRLAAMPTHFEILPTLHASPHQPKIHFFAFVLSFLQVSLSSLLSYRWWLDLQTAILHRYHI